MLSLSNQADDGKRAADLRAPRGLRHGRRKLLPVMIDAVAVAVVAESNRAG